MAFCPEHPKRDQNPKFTPLSETTSILTPFICGVHPPGLKVVTAKWCSCLEENILTVHSTTINSHSHTNLVMPALWMEAQISRHQ